jgi:hypothetical protein
VATYKVLQDIEAEDTLVGPLTLRQCIYAGIAVLGIYLSVVAWRKDASWLIILLFPFIAFGVFFAVPWSKQQPTEVWALAKIRFLLKPRRRIWNQSGIKQLVTITVPKTSKPTYTNGLTPQEVQRRLRALADTIDSRGWAVKNVDLDYLVQPQLAQNFTDSDRLMEAYAVPEATDGLDANASDMFDTQYSPVAKNLDQMMSRAGTDRRQQIMQQIAPSQPAVPGQQVVPTQPAPTGQGTDDTGDPAANYWHMHTILPAPVAGADPTTDDAPVAPYVLPMDTPMPNPAMPVPGIAAPAGQPLQSVAPGVTPTPDPAILNLANNNDLNVATIAREAQARRGGDTPNEVTVSLH